MKKMMLAALFALAALTLAAHARAAGSTSVADQLGRGPVDSRHTMR